MTKCNRCNIKILDDSLVCPLCRGVLERTEAIAHSALYADKNKSDKTKSGVTNVQEPDIDMDDIGMDEIEMYQSKSVMYPDINPAMKKMKLVIKLFISTDIKRTYHDFFTIHSF